jgi:hypothetical protein
LAVLGLLAGCSSSEQHHANPVAPSAMESTSQAPSDGGAIAGTSAGSGAGIALPPEGNVGPSDVTFPPRNEPLLFRTALEAKYRDGLRRGTVLTYVDQEGTVVWTQEYLRYRVNLCPHAEAVFRVFRQIDGFGVQPVCGSTSSVVFPPRNEPFDFMIQLEAKYRDSLRRTAGPTYVDVEGNIVWTQEYLRYRVSGCGHIDAQQRVFDQIDGRGVQPACDGGGGGSTTTFSGSIEALGAGYYTVTMAATGRYQATLTWPDASIDLDLYLATTACSNYPPTSCILTASRGVGVNTEQISWPVRAGEQYRLWIDNFTSRSTSFTVNHFITTAGGQSGVQMTPSEPVLMETGSRAEKSKR